MPVKVIVLSKHSHNKKEKRECVWTIDVKTIHILIQTPCKVERGENSNKSEETSCKSMIHIIDQWLIWLVLFI